MLRRGSQLWGALAALVLLAFAIRHVRQGAFTAHLESQRYEDVYYVPPSQWLPLFSLGYQAALADLLWCRALVYFGEEFIRHRSAKHLYDYTDAMLTLDSEFRAPYRWVATIAFYRPGEFDLQDAERAVSYLRDAVRKWPNDGELAWELGAALRFEIAPYVKDRSYRRKLEEEAAEFLSAAALLGAGPPWLALNSSSLLHKLGKNEQAIRHLEEVYGTVQDPTTKANIAAQLARLRSEAYATAMTEANDQLEAARKRDFPYVDSSLFLVLGPKAQPGRMSMITRNFLPSNQGEVLLDE